MLSSTNVACMRSISVRYESEQQFDINDDLMRRAQQALVSLGRLCVTSPSPSAQALNSLSSWSQVSYLQLNASFHGYFLTREHALAFGSLPFLRYLSLFVSRANARCPWVLSTLLENVTTQIEVFEFMGTKLRTQQNSEWETVGEECVRIANRRFEDKCVDFWQTRICFHLELFYRDECIPPGILE